MSAREIVVRLARFVWTVVLAVVLVGALGLYGAFVFAGGERDGASVDCSP